MAKQIGAGDLIERVHAERREDVDDGYGNRQATWVRQFACRAAYRHLRGGEDVLAGRLAGVHSTVIVVRRSRAALAVATDWRLVDDRDGTVWAVRDVTHETDRTFISFLCQRGVAA